MNMLKSLNEAILQLPSLLRKPEIWKSLLIDYDHPVVERVYTGLPNGNRLSLHVIHPCDENQVFFHPHPWPSAVYIASGNYKMKVGYGSGLKTPTISHTLVLAQGSSYEMTDPNSWHSVQPEDSESCSVMLSGPEWNREMPKMPESRLRPLTEDRKIEIMQVFRGITVGF